MRTPLVHQVRRLARLGLAVALVALAAACSSGGSSPETTAPTSEAAPATTAADTGAASAETGSPTTSADTEAPDTGASDAEPSPVAKASCADELKPGTPQAIACGWIAQTDPAVCAQMSDRMLGELFGASGSAGAAQCKSVLGGLPPAEDASLVTFSAPEREGKRATLVLADGNQDIVYAFRFARSGGRWTIDQVQQLSNAGSEGSDETPETVTPNSAGDDGEIAALVTRWYADADPGVCDSMTDAMLDFGWGAKGNKGRSLCEQSLADAEPVEDVEVRTPTVAGDEATVEVVYTLDGDRQVDEISLVRVNGAWLVDAVQLAGFAS